MKIYIPHSTSFDYENELYSFVKQSQLFKDHTVVLPHDAEMTNIYDFLKTCDLVIAEVSYPSTGQGIELGWAFDNQVPIICIYKSGSSPSSSLKYISNTIIEYSSVPEVLAKISTQIAQSIQTTQTA